MDEIDALLETLEQNEAIEKKFFDVEVSILSILNFRDFFEKLLSEIKEKFLIPFVWVTFIDNNDHAKLIIQFASSELLNQKLSLIESGDFLSIVGSHTRPLLVNEDLRPFYKMLPQNERYLIRSMAIAPITLDGDIIGSLNFGDTYDSRYFPGMDTSLLERLAVKVSICLSNVMAHEKLQQFVERNSR
jgi:GAF domain-containing protein